MISPTQTPKQVLIISATEQEVSDILKTLTPRQRTDVLLTATKIVKNMFVDTSHLN